MNKIVGIVERILRIVMFVVAVAMLGGALFLIGIHQTNKLRKDSCFRTNCIWNRG